jgi:hypothetical protein
MSQNKKTGRYIGLTALDASSVLGRYDVSQSISLKDQQDKNSSAQRDQFTNSIGASRLNALIQNEDCLNRNSSLHKPTPG